MRYLFIFILAFQFFSGYAQPLRDINYQYLYNPGLSFNLLMKPERSGENWSVWYQLQLRDTTMDLSEFRIQWDVRNNLSDKEGQLVKVDSIAGDLSGKPGFSGKIDLAASTSAKILTAKVIHNPRKTAWIFYKVITPEYPTDGGVVVNGEPVLNTYIRNDVAASLKSNVPNNIVSYYEDDFPAAAPGFSEALGKVSKGMRVDSTFTVAEGQEIIFKNIGLYLVQRDTNATQGFAFRAESDYPKLAKLESLADPLIYICTPQEFERIKLAKGDKKAFDRVILSITKNAERAKDFMRAYFRRVELANHYFSSYKEGWKTDRGMIYIIFGLPNEVFKSTDREIWNYKNSSFKVTFEFVKSGTLFDPDNYVLVRNNKYRETWYEVVDLWRNARF